MAKIMVTREQINAWNRMRETTLGTPNYHMFSLAHEYKAMNGHYTFLGWGGIHEHRIEHPNEVFYIKKIKDETYLYWEYLTECERWTLSDLAKAFFGVQGADMARVITNTEIWETMEQKIDRSVRWLHDLY